MDTYEKKYKEALGWMQSLYNGLHGKTKEEAEHYFPELKSEDERIRKGLIKAVSRTFDGNKLFGTDVTREEALAWLEKQGEQKYIPKYKIGDYVKNTNYKGEPIYEIVYMDKECYICEYRGKERMGDKAVMHFSFDNPYLRLVQKPTDNIEPKFKVGDAIKITGINNGHTGYSILNLEDGYYYNWKLIDKKPAWSEKDEQHIDSLLKRLDGLCRNEFERTRFAINEDGDWLKSLKQRIGG